MVLVVGRKMVMIMMRLRVMMIMTTQIRNVTNEWVGNT